MSERRVYNIHIKVGGRTVATFNECILTNNSHLRCEQTISTGVIPPPHTRVQVDFFARPNRHYYRTGTIESSRGPGGTEVFLD